MKKGHFNCLRVFFFFFGGGESVYEPRLDLYSPQLLIRIYRNLMFNSTRRNSQKSLGTVIETCHLTKRKRYDIGLHQRLSPRVFRI